MEGAEDAEDDGETSDQDEYGRSTRSQITDDYREEMLRLEQKLKHHKSINAESGSEQVQKAVGARDAITPNFQQNGQEKAMNKSGVNKSTSTKAVRFADELDIANPPTRNVQTHQDDNQDSPEVNPDPGVILSNQVVERTNTHTIEPPDPDDVDTALLQQQLAMQYNRVRNRMIQKQGGFAPTEEDEVAPLYEEKDGQIKKVSRFKAARLRRIDP
jgi:unconventional prefoldin RPB5 interactor 1